MLENNELVSESTNNHISAYYSANKDGQPLEYTNIWRGQKFVFDPKGTEGGIKYGTIRHVDSGRCLHPENGPANAAGQRLVVWGDCSNTDRIMYKVQDGKSSYKDCWADFICETQANKGEVCRGDSTTMHNGFPVINNGKCIQP